MRLHPVATQVEADWEGQTTTLDCSPAKDNTTKCRHDESKDGADRPVLREPMRWYAPNIALASAMDPAVVETPRRLPRNSATGTATPNDAAVPAAKRRN
jgi:hypothetical protein